jgi:quinol monooxygenase YgiN
VGQLYTSGDWVAKKGLESAFIEAWKDLALWTTENVESATWVALLRDDENPRLFRSFGPWESRESIDAWRESDGFKERVGKIRDLIDSFDAKTMEAVVEIG